MTTQDATDRATKILRAGASLDTEASRRRAYAVMDGYHRYRTVGAKGVEDPDAEKTKRRGLYKPTRELISDADDILVEYYVGHGFPLTLRQLFYKLVTKNMLRNTKDDYDKLGDVMKNARYWGLISWDMLIDRGRTVFEFETYGDETDALGHLGEKFAIDLWKEQPTRVEVWVEKDAAIGTIERVCSELQVPWASTRGYHSTSGAKQAAGRLLKMMKDQNVLVLHIADHDPSGWDMTRDLDVRINEFILEDMERYEAFGGDLEIRRVALNMDQVHTLLPRSEDGKPLSQTVKTADPRAPKYMKRFGQKCWELDALEPTDLADIIREPVRGVLDTDRWSAALDRQAAARKRLLQVGSDWTWVVASLNGRRHLPRYYARRNSHLGGRFTEPRRPRARR
jgi:hypothetical protein